MHQFPVRLISEFTKLFLNVLPVIFKNCVKDATNILKHHSPGPNFINEANGCRKKVTFIQLAQLLSGFGERRARKATGQKINALERDAIKRSQVAFKDVPRRLVQSKSCTGVLVDFNQANVLKPSLMVAESLTASTRTKLQNG